MIFVVLFQTKPGQTYCTYKNIFYLKMAYRIYRYFQEKKYAKHLLIFCIFSRFLLQLVSSAPVLDHTPVSLNVVETNPFKHLTHLSLKFLPGNDAEIKKFLASCLKCLKVKRRFVIAATRPWCYVYLSIFFHSYTSKVCTKLYALV